MPVGDRLTEIGGRAARCGGRRIFDADLRLGCGDISGLILYCATDGDLAAGCDRPRRFSIGQGEDVDGVPLVVAGLNEFQLQRFDIEIVIEALPVESDFSSRQRTQTQVEFRRGGIDDDR